MIGLVAEFLMVMVIILVLIMAVPVFLAMLAGIVSVLLVLYLISRLLGSCF